MTRFKRRNRRKEGCRRGHSTIRGFRGKESKGKGENSRGLTEEESRTFGRRQDN